jgi:hypothetical protein
MRAPRNTEHYELCITGVCETFSKKMMSHTRKYPWFSGNDDGHEKKDNHKTGYEHPVGFKFHSTDIG